MDPRSSTDDHASAAVERRRAFRAFVRAHHPDVGGDPAVFAATVAAYRALERDQPAPGARRPPTDAEARSRSSAVIAPAVGPAAASTSPLAAVHQSRTRQGDQDAPQHHWQPLASRSAGGIRRGSAPSSSSPS